MSPPNANNTSLDHQVNTTCLQVEWHFQDLPLDGGPHTSDRMPPFNKNLNFPRWQIILSLIRITSLFVVKHLLWWYPMHKQELPMFPPPQHKNRRIQSQNSGWLHHVWNLQTRDRKGHLLPSQKASSHPQAEGFNSRESNITYIVGSR